MAKILIVDDDPDVIEASRIVLEREGHTIESASNAVDGFRAIKESHPDLLILDVMLEEVDDGLLLARRLRREGHKLPILMVTNVNWAMGLHLDKDKEMVPVDELVEKPVAPAALVEKVRALLAGREGTQC